MQLAWVDLLILTQQCNKHFRHYDLEKRLKILTLILIMKKQQREAKIPRDNHNTAGISENIQIKTIDMNNHRDELPLFPSN